MSIILNIDTATDNALISIADNRTILSSLNNNRQNQHAAFLQKGIQKLITNCNLHLNDIDAIAVAHGPGSYTGIRIGMASAKGLCFILNKPLITVNTLEIMTTSVLQNKDWDGYLFCPLLDARRMEVFTAVYNNQLKEIIPPTATSLNTDFLYDLLKTNKILFFGNGLLKWQSICTSANAYFKDIRNHISFMHEIAYNKLIINDLSDIKHSSPLYLKAFYQAGKSSIH